MKTNLLAKILFAAGAMLAIATAARAQLYIATGSTGVTTWFTFTIDTVSDKVTVVVDNTHPGLGGITGTVTNFGFNIPASLAGTGSLFSTSGVPAGTWHYSEPFGLSNFNEDVGAHTGPNDNGGHPPDGVMAGHTATFVFQFGDITGATGFLGANGVSLKWQELSTNGRSDHGWGNPSVDINPTGSPVPEPSSYGLMGAASLLAGLGLRRRMQKKAMARPVASIAADSV